jgi:hypothetical protein
LELFEKTLYRWQRDEFTDGTFERRYIPEFNAVKKIDQSWPSLREQTNKLLYNWKYVAECFEEETFNFREAIETSLWKVWTEKRFKMIQGSGYDEKCCWLAMGGFRDSENVKERINSLRKEFVGKY